MNKTATIMLLLLAAVALADTTTWFTVGGNLAHPYAYEDVNVNTSSAPVGGAAPGFAEFPAGSLAFAYYFDKASDECLRFSLQLPHSYAEGQSISPHVHWAPSTNGDTGYVSWRLSYAIQEVGGVYGAAASVYANDQCAGTQFAHETATFADISDAGLKISSIMIGEICRDGDGTGGTDSYDADAVLLGFDIHVPVNSNGSRQVGTK